ncbi:hypothetical protein WB66_04210 [bacteria symbiont BFo1 of Frankliniella occidentalis]|nr:hypothetical protein AI28_14570 [bacteria symbiont BFo1 of Frankliniella occidentalis]KYP86318.1 hypothetical protein WB66_04210 [bacteria symbiont BFo1 of Frankliniella occidentalis]
MVSIPLLNTITALLPIFCLAKWVLLIWFSIILMPVQLSCLMQQGESNRLAEDLLRRVTQITM